MNIVIVSQCFYPDNFRINSIAEELVQQGHSVTVITGLPDYTASVVPKEYRWFRRRKEQYRGIQVLRVPTIARRKGVIFRALNYGSFVLSASLYALFCGIKSVDAIFVNQTSPVLQAIPAIILKHRTNKKLVLYCSDLWPESLKAWNIRENSLFFHSILRISEKIYQACDTIAITSTPFREYLMETCGVNGIKIQYLPQHFEDLYEDICNEWTENGCIDFVFAGNIGSVQNIDCIIHAAELLPPDGNYKIHIIGNGSELDNCRTLVQQGGLQDKIVFYGRYPLEELKKFYKIADCFLLTLRGGDFIGQTLPAKTQGYLCAGRPVLGAIDGAAKAMIDEADCGECVSAGDYKALSEKMNFIINHFDLYRQKGLNGRRFYEEQFTKKKFMSTLINLIN